MIADKAQVILPSDRDVQVTRTFKAPRALVYRAYTEPSLVQRWMLGPPGWTMPVCEMDVRVGGSYRWRWRSDQDGSEFGFSGVFREVEPASRLVHSERYDPGDVEGQLSDLVFPCEPVAGTGESGGDAIVTVTFTEADGLTTVTTLIDFGSREARDAAVATGMTDGMEQGYQRLDALLAQPPAN